MYEIRRNVKVKDFDKETKDFLLDIGFSQEDDLSSMFENFLGKKHIDLNEKCNKSNLYADNLELEKSHIYQCTEDDEFISFKNKKSESFSFQLNEKTNQTYRNFREGCVC